MSRRFKKEGDRMLCDELVSLAGKSSWLARQDCSGSSTTTAERSPIGQPWKRVGHLLRSTKQRL